MEGESSNDDSDNSESERSEVSGISIKYVSNNTDSKQGTNQDVGDHLHDHIPKTKARN